MTALGCIRIAGIHCDDVVFLSFTVLLSLQDCLKASIKVQSCCTKDCTNWMRRMYLTQRQIKYFALHFG